MLPDTSIARIPVPSWAGAVPTMAERALAAVHDLRESLAETRVVGIDVQRLAGLRVGHDHEADVRQLALAGIGEPDRQRLVSPREEAQRLLPTRHREEVGHDEDERATLDRTERRLDELRERRGRRALQARPSLHLVDESQDLHPPATCGNDLLDVLAVQDRADAVAVAREETRDETDEGEQEVALVSA